MSSLGRGAGGSDDEAPVILAGAPDTFARSVFHDRHPKLIERVVEAHPYGERERAALRALLAETLHGTVEPLRTAALDAEDWAWWGEPWWGRTWGELPFLWAESYFYRRLLEATGYFGPGIWAGIDPFGPTKAAELDSAAVTAELAALDELADAPEAAARDALLLSALWGNQADLGFQLVAGSDTRSDGLLVDDRRELWAALTAAPAAGLHLIADNAGRELLPDLALLDHLLTSGTVATATVWLKPQPYFTSDATMSDLLAALRRLRAAGGAAGRLGDRLWQAQCNGALTARTHEFFCAPLGFDEMPNDLRAAFDGAALTVCKGDLNYRRLVGDRYLPPTTLFADLVGYFPSPVAALRTLKSDVIAGLSADRVAALDATGQPWRSNGEHALIQCAR
ncbi:damage-control phosphatase ARMT1 family protein [Nocardia sp. alder85J]|uniref:damage-control phosphatase ARMT1 family protein n=1 Tax=Nocardia sp. alder85J TaxID=2862949 RepID=UPI001CD27872|nr:damage-control phosphatase ARMT1 family protein [Nocardia sp. alder85J]MCX4096295.1 damage-control phosphatase ARMT1 family protein [Nocardia sp. alder85J]